MNSSEINRVVYANTEINATKRITKSRLNARVRYRQDNISLCLYNKEKKRKKIEDFSQNQ